MVNNERDTLIVFREFHNSARVARNAVSQEIAEISKADGATFEDIAHLASGARGRDRVLMNGDMEGGLWWASQAQGLIQEVASCSQVVQSIVWEARRIITERLQEQLQ